MKGTALVTASVVVLTVALAASGWMLFQALDTLEQADGPAEAATPEEAEDERTRLLGTVARLHVGALAEDHADESALHAALRTAAASVASAGGTSERLPVRCVAVSRASGSSALLDWVSDPLDGAERGWIVQRLAAIATEGAMPEQHVSGRRHLRGVAFAAVSVAGRPYTAGLYWRAPRADVPASSD